MVEGIQGEGGIRPAEARYLLALRQVRLHTGPTESILG
jgi:acetylornithine/succinyldiaminopimelate/putrescine aminotransferase